MNTYLTRRKWLKTSAAAVAGWLAGSGLKATGAGWPLRSVGGAGDFVKLNSNESHFGISEAAREAIMGALDGCSVYPDDDYYELKELIAARENLKPENIILGAGSIEVVTAALHIWMPRGEALVSDPTYYDFADYAARARCPLRQVPVDARYGLDLQAIERRVGSSTGLVYLCNPQNPTGVMTPHSRLRPFCRTASRKALVVLDEAYGDYVDDPAYSSMADLVREGENVLVTRTFSKIHGLAGLRVGYGMARPDLIRELTRMERNFAPVSSLALRASIASYRDEEFLRKVRRQNQDVKALVYEELRRLGLAFIPSHANFVLIRVGGDSRELAKKLEARSVLVRPFEFGGVDWIRVSLGTPEEMRIFISHLEALGAERDGAGYSRFLRGSRAFSKFLGA
jgi:histidinol-phosphate aminotransferase